MLSTPKETWFTGPLPAVTENLNTWITQNYLTDLSLARIVQELRECK
jgi:hypothetical protein